MFDVRFGFATACRVTIHFAIPVAGDEFDFEACDIELPTVPREYEYEHEHEY